MQQFIEGDRFIAARISQEEAALAHHALTSSGISTPPASPAASKGACSPNADYKHCLQQAVFGEQVEGNKILRFKGKAPVAPSTGVAEKAFFATSAEQTRARSNVRHISSAPKRILDAPEMLDDYYLNVLDWSSENMLAVALGSTAWIWNAESGSISQLCTLEENNYISSMKWMMNGVLAVGTSENLVQIWDVKQGKRLRKLQGHSERVSSLAYHDMMLASGSGSGKVMVSDTRIREHEVSLIQCHEQECCALKFNEDGMLATGGNDNKVNIFNAGSWSAPRHSLEMHQGAVKALAWVPFQRNVLCSGGGAADRKIHFTNAITGERINSIDTGSQVTSLCFSSTTKEFVAGLGYSSNSLHVYSYPSLTRLAELNGHSARILHTALSPDGSTVCSASADETLRFWDVWGQKSVEQKPFNFSQGVGFKSSKSMQKPLR